MNILEDKSLRFHGVGHNVFKYISILQHGILTKQDSNNVELYSKNYGGYNQDNMISMAISPSEFGTYKHGAFGVFISRGIGFVLKDCQGIRASRTNHDSGFADEEFHIGSIPTSNIAGIIINKELSQKRVTDLHLFDEMGTGYVDSTCETIIKYLQKNCGIKDINMDEINNIITTKNNLGSQDIDFFDRMKQEKELISKLNTVLVGYIDRHFKQLLGKEEVSIIDIVEHYNEEHLPIYDETGALIEHKELSTTDIVEHNNDEIGSSLTDKELSIKDIGKKTIGATTDDKKKITGIFGKWLSRIRGKSGIDRDD